MDVFGFFAFVFGLGTLVLRLRSPDSPLLVKLEPMRAHYGRDVGTAIHWVAYTVAPLVIGGGLLLF